MRLVLLPGLDGTGELFSGLVDELAGQFELIVVRYPPDRFLSYEELGPVIEARLPDEPYVLVAESFSSPLAIRIAERGPDSLRGLVLCAGFAKSPVGGLLKHLCWVIAPLLLALPVPRFVAEAVLIGPGAPGTLYKALRGTLATIETTVLVGRLREVLASEETAGLIGLTIPILYLQAKEDRLVGRGSCDAIRHLQPAMAVAVIPGPHLILQREPKRCAEVIARFAEGVFPKVV